MASFLRVKKTPLLITQNPMSNLLSGEKGQAASGERNQDSPTEGALED